MSSQIVRLNAPLAYTELRWLWGISQPQAYIYGSVAYNRSQVTTDTSLFSIIVA